jgi:hypothetical protein
MRLVDRVCVRFFHQITMQKSAMIQLMSHDEDVMPDALAGLAARQHCLTFL